MKIITILLALLIIIFIFSYFNIFRYLSLHIRSPDPLISNYSNLPKASDERVVISFTTTPDNISKIQPMLNSILDQTVKVDQIALNIPYKYENRDYDIPKKYEDIVNIFRTNKNYKEGLKYIPTLLREKDSKTIIIYLDDNQIYDKHLIENLVKASEKFPNKAIYTKGNLDSSGGVLVKPDFFNTDVIGYLKNNFDTNWASENLKVDKVKVDNKNTYKSFMI